MSSDKRLILIRHAHRDTAEGRELDNGLSKKGKLQAKLLAEYFVEVLDGDLEDDNEPALLASPTKRCIQTLKPLAKAWDLQIESTQLLYEQNPDETWEQFERRIRFFCASWEKSKTATTILCSHGDWIPSCVFQLVNLGIKLKKGGFVEFVVDDDGVQMRTLLQTLKPLAS